MVVGVHGGRSDDGESCLLPGANSPFQVHDLATLRLQHARGDRRTATAQALGDDGLVAIRRRRRIGQVTKEKVFGLSDVSCLPLSAA